MIAATIIRNVIRGYQWILSPLLGTRCRFEPSCSHYAQEAISQFGISKGLLLSLKRLSRCHPWGKHGVDPVPPSPM